MKKIIITAVVLVIATGAITSAGLHYKNTTLKKRNAETVAINNQIAEFGKKVEALKQTQAQLSANNALLLAECQKGLVAHAALPLATKAKTPAPVCQVQ